MAESSDKAQSKSAAEGKDDAPGKPRRRWLKFTLLGMPLLAAAAMFVTGIVFWGGFNTAMEATNTLGFCISCHEMEDTVYQEYKKTAHFQNRTGVRATCSDCHVPDPWVHKVVRKIQATRELYYKFTGSIDTPAKFEAKRLQLAKRVWKTMKATDSRECRNCHNFQSMAPESQRPRARKQHMNAFKTGQTCIDCHKGVAHKNVRDQLAEDELEALEQPRPAFVRTIPDAFLEGLKRAEAEEAEREAKKAAKAQAAEAAVAARIENAVKGALADYAAKVAKTETAKAETATTPETAKATDVATATPATTPAGGSGSGEAKTVTLFYPGQASYEWVQTGKDHGGARAFRRAGDRCAECHAKELKDMGAKIVSGEKVEPTPIPDKRPAVDLKVQASHDAENLYFRFQWPAGKHTPVPFVDGGKMDPDNQIKLAVMIAGDGIDKVAEAGCWVTCHHDSRYMPDHPETAALEGAGEVKQRLDLAGGITKYLGESRSKVEVSGRRGKKRGGWDKLKGEADMAELEKAGAFMDLIRFRSGGPAENGHVLAQRVMKGGAPIKATGKLDGNVWTVEMSRPLKADKPGDLNLEPGKLYTIGFALHDDYTSARFHHVSLEYRFGLDNAEAEINAVKR
ncbi:MAG: NapC/NirT family cytochrome c [Methyloligellaceae bacterium]